MPRSQGDVDRNNGGEIAIRGIIAFLVHLLSGVVAMAVIYVLTSDFEQASDALRRSVGTADDAEASVLAYLTEARASLTAWVVLSLVGSWIAATLFIAVAQRHEPRNDDEARRCFAIWGILLIVTVFVSGLFWWRRVLLSQVGFVLADNDYATILAVTAGVMLLAYYVSTAMVVKHTVKRSVPGAIMLPSIRK